MIKKEQTTDTCYSMDSPQRHYAKKEARHIKYILYNSIYMMFLENIKLYIQKADQRVSGVKMGAGIDCDEHKRTFWGDGNVPKLNCVNGWTAV